ncbi:MAG: 23S rRNA (pseudouridine(1915)-N(3))-methyltransferase RlmH [Candidatus Wallbacteria bacterium]|nr:23S rRNA (pseudouridine(1915)-N(3))-methyltransferase RlmH [Candidatus Wallbacteria bacterium]
MRIFLLAVGAIKKKEIRKLIDEYTLWLKPYLPFTTVEVQASRPARGRDCREEEGARISSFLTGKKMRLIALDESGVNVSSHRFSEMLENPGCDLCFVIGGPEGLSDKIKSRADQLMSLSRMTFTSDMARLVFTEQIFRAVKIARGEPYHR